MVTHLDHWLQAAFREVAGDAVDIGTISAIEATRPEFGDFQCNAALGLAKRLGQPPRPIAEKVLRVFPLPDCVERAEVAGPGFINVWLKTAWLADYLEALDADENLGIPSPGRGRTLVLDYSSPNVAKPMHIGHIRSTIIGNALDRLYRALGYRVIADNHVGDWGTQFGVLLMGYRHFVDVAQLEHSPIEELERVYVKSQGRAESDPAWMEACRLELVKLQSGVAEHRALWQRFVTLSFQEFDRMYRRLGVSFDLVRGESYYHDRLPDLVRRLETERHAHPSEGALVVFLEEEGLPACLVRKRDGAFNYATTDIATVLSRVEEFAPDRIIYVTDERQQLHFRQVFAVCRRLGVRTPLVHVWFGLMRLPDGTCSTRDGNVIRLETLLDEAERRALAVVQKTSPDMSPDEQREVARIVGMGAVKYADLSQNPQTTITFTWDKALALDGNSAPYLQYAYARMASVQDKYRERFPDLDFSRYPVRLDEPIERALALKLIRFPAVVTRAAEAYRPNFLADFLYDLARTYSTFYQNVPFLAASEGVRESRVRLGALIARILKRGLYLLGIETRDRI